MNLEQAEKLAQQTVSPVVNQAQQLTIEDQDSCELAYEVLKLIDAKEKEIDGDDSLGGIKRATYATWKKASDVFNKYMQPLATAKGIIKNKILAYDRKCEEEKRQLELAEQERLRLEQQAIAAQEAEQLRASGDTELAQMVEEQAAVAPPPVVVMESARPRTSGVSVKAKWTWKFITTEEDALRLIVKAAAEDDRYLSCLMINTKNLNSKAEADKSLMKVPGVQAYNAGSVAVRA
jgi:hypothetical protein